MRRLAQKKKCLQHRALIVAWLRVNYCLRASGSIAKRDVFVHYIELCRANRIQPSSAASFGKILKMAFPTVKCNRVGPRGASKHHYRGLVLRDTYQLSLENVEPISDAAIAEMMRNMEDNDNNDDDDDDDDDTTGGDAHSAVKSESSGSAYASPTQQQQQQPPHSYLSSSSSPSPSPPPYNGYAAQFMPPPPAAYAAYPPLPPALSAAIKPAYMLPPPSQPQNQHYMAPHDLKKAESFSWISPDMHESRSTACAQQPPSQAAYREWAEKRDLVEFCERNFQSLYDTILRFNCGEGKDQVLTHVAEAWKNLRQYTQHMNLFPEAPTSTSAAAKAKQAGGTGDYAQGEGKRDQEERYNQLGNDYDELKRKAMLDVGYSSSSMLPHHHQQFHQPLSAYQHHQQAQQQQQQQQHNSKRPYTSSSPQSSHGGSDHYAAAAPPALPPPSSSSSTTTGSTPPLVSFSGSSSSLSLSWLNSLPFSVNNSQYQQSQPTHYTSYHRTTTAGGAGPNAAAASSYQLPSFAASAEGGNRGGLEGLEYRSFEWKGAFE
ncbi:RFX DNAbinding domain containing protein [Acanthamoeba castellanii str. Neff]|uniref:RFX DNAbinding domain containing protein n=1 Tax=Acanthamoeba castellanii (strain ATCC 30010 / Neff) TaxID=1257118 RepID=L8GXF7_ACACF|nr:RFX DNAbinding domain containing protein [Acanthamoeba castellanii str. Neff]ELR16766.1 RFX DNAbinding domain containing protein [Acanthamoeba castellanii str. Neff]